MCIHEGPGHSQVFNKVGFFWFLSYYHIKKVFFFLNIFGSAIDTFTRPSSGNTIKRNAYLV